MYIKPIRTQINELLKSGSSIGVNRGASTSVFYRPVCITGHWIIMEPKGSPGKEIWTLISREMEEIAKVKEYSWQYTTKYEKHEFPHKTLESVVNNVNMLKMDGRYFPDPEQYLEARLEEGQIVLHVDFVKAGVDFIGFPVPESLRNTDGESEYIYFNIDMVLMFAQMGLDMYYLPDSWVPAVLTETFEDTQEIVGLVMPLTWTTKKQFGKIHVLAENGTLIFPYDPVG